MNPQDYPFWPFPLDPRKPRNKHEIGFWQVHALEPQIYQAVDQLAKSLLVAGRGHYGIKEFFESLRWDSRLSMNGEEFKMNNNYPAYYARFWLQNNSQYWGFFELRRVKGEYRPRPELDFDDNGQASFL